MTDSVRRARARLHLLPAGLALAALAPCARTVRAQTGRTLPETTELGRLRIEVFPQARLDGNPVMLGAGARIRDEQNVIRPPASIDGERRVAFTRGAMGEIVEVWLLTDDEFRAVAARIAAARRAATQR